MKNYYQNYCKTPSQASMVFQAKLPNGTSITAYKKSGKVLFQGKNSFSEQKIWAKTGTKIDAEKKEANNNSLAAELPANIAKLNIIGSDESGSGDYFGPLTVAAAYVREEDHDALNKLGVRDSKLLDDTNIAAIAEQLKKIVPFSLLVLNNKKYNIAQKKGINQGEMKARLHAKAIVNVINKIAPLKADGILIDQFCLPHVFFSYIKNVPYHDKIPTDTTNCYFSTKAEGLSLAVAAASIIARAAFVQRLHELSTKLGENIPKGAGNNVDKFAAKILHHNSPEYLADFAKLHFANTKKARCLSRVLRF